ncbi:hypothetical protein IWX47DRAFT_852607, partial [Phyllosticta citricarpa]
MLAAAGVSSAPGPRRVSPGLLLAVHLTCCCSFLNPPLPVCRPPATSDPVCRRGTSRKKKNNKKIKQKLILVGPRHCLLYLLLLAFHPPASDQTSVV